MSIQIGLLGVGHLGKIHRKCIDQIESLSLTAVYDPDPEALKDIPASLVAHSVNELLEKVDAVDIVAPTSAHAALASSALKAGKHVFIEKPVTSTPAEAAALLALQNEAATVVQVGHVERFNPAMLSIEDIHLEPRFLEVHRLATFNPRGTDVSVVLDLMIHDLDILLSLVKGEITNIKANGVAIISETCDIANARIEWSNGCVANVTASRVSLKSMRKMRIFQSDAYVALDFLDRSAQIIQLTEDPDALDPEETVLTLDGPQGQRHIHIHSPETPVINAIQTELEQFAESILLRKPPAVGLQEGYLALQLAHEIDSMIIEQLRE
ncbi:MAG: Gfo/Idh/MocA family oxidoreductase [Saprospiraceae bacterium]|nr:Gfo/Idh/MocA family oxidoreductase [Saprospiraceae bacterium]